MVATFLGFGGRIGRLSYFLWSLALAAVLTALVMIVAMGSMGGESPDDGFPAGLLPVGVLAVWSGTALMAKRLRDIGWPPLWVLPGWVCFGIIDAWVAMEVPSLAAGENGQTGLGLLVELGLILALLFWPGRADDDAYELPDADTTRRAYREAHLRRRRLG